MLQRWLVGLVVLSTLACWVRESAWSQDGPKGATSRYALDVRSRKFGQDGFDEKTQKFGIEIYVDGNNNNALYLSEVGSLSTVASGSFKIDAEKIKNPKWQHGLNLAARKSTDKDFAKARRYGIEVLKDLNSGNLIYVCETGAIATVSAQYASETPNKILNPEWKASMILKVRKAGEKDFTKDTKKVGVECFLDENNGNYVYISDTGSICAVPGKVSNPVAGAKDPEWMHGMELEARKVGEDKFTDKTKKYGLEVFKDANTGNLVYLCETGDIAVVPAKLTTATEGMTKGPEFKYGLDLESRKAGELKFSPSTKKYAFEIYADANNGNTIYISDLGVVSVVPAKRE